MDRINFDHVIPNVFAGQDLQSDIWNEKVSFQRGKLYLIEADSGKGKSTFCSYLTGYRSDYEGKICFDDNDVKTFSMSKWGALRRTSISLLFQELRLFPELTAMENVIIKNDITSHKSIDEIHSWFRQFGIEDKVNEKIGRMSFGQQQRVAMMRALSQPFDFLLVDEPISHLDDTNSSILASAMMDEARRQGAGVIVTSIGKHMELPYDVILRL